MDSETAPGALIAALATLTGQAPTDPALVAACTALADILQHGYGRVCWTVTPEGITLRPEPQYRIPPPTIRRGT